MKIEEDIESEPLRNHGGKTFERKPKVNVS